MSLILPIHVVAGLIAIVAGAVALVVVKGLRVHRKSGMVFVWAMSVMAGTALFVAAEKDQWANFMQGILAFYMVVTGYLAVQPMTATRRRWEIASLAFGLSIVVTYVFFGLAALNSPKGHFSHFPPMFYVIFGSIALISCIGDVRLLRGSGLRGGPRLVRHLWRMGFSMFIAAGSFFLGQPQVFPEPVKHIGLRALPVLAVILTMTVWWWKVRGRQSVAGIRGLVTTEGAGTQPGS
jgi:uncharacterized membrane protein